MVEIPAAFVISPHAVAPTVRDILASAGVLLYSVTYPDKGAIYKLMAVRTDTDTVGQYLSARVGTSDFNVLPGLSHDKISNLSVGDRLLVLASLSPSSTPPRSLEGKRWDFFSRKP